jgi:hypothetical protein
MGLIANCCLFMVAVSLLAISLVMITDASTSENSYTVSYVLIARSIVPVIFVLQSLRYRQSHLRLPGRRFRHLPESRHSSDRRREKM